MKTVITLTIDHSKPIEDLLDKVAGRAYTLAGVENVTARLHDLLELPVIDMEPEEGELNWPPLAVMGGRE